MILQNGLFVLPAGVVVSGITPAGSVISIFCLIFIFEISQRTAEINFQGSTRNDLQDLMEILIADSTELSRQSEENLNVVQVFFRLS